jgi:galactokinase
VLPVAIGNEIKMAARRTSRPKLNLFSGNFSERSSFALRGAPVPPRGKGWHNYFLAVVAQFIQRGISIPGLDVAIKGDVPLGAGLSSSAAYEVCAAVLLDAICGTGIDRRDLALLAQAAEHSDYVGVRCGIMDQFISALGSTNHALLIDCHSLDYQLFPFDSTGASIVIINSMKRRGLMDSEYNQRRHECEEGLRLMRELTGVAYETVRHIPMDVFTAHAAQLPENSRKRLRHNLSENARVLSFSEGLRKSDWSRLGQLLYESHASLRDDFNVSCRELDRIVEIASGCDGVYGCRMTGAGFGGCAVALVRPEMVEAFITRLSGEYQAAVGVKPDVYVSAPAAGAEVKRVDGVSPCVKSGSKELGQ